MKINKFLIISIIIFLILGGVALYLILNKGYIGDKSLVAYEEIHELSVKVDKENLSVTEDEETNIHVYLDGVEISENYKLSIDKEELIDLEGNTITAKKVGVATITAEVEGYDLVSTVQVTNYRPVKKMKLTAVSSTLKVGNDRQLTLMTTPSNATRTSIKFTSSDEEVATVNNNGIITGISKGTVIITATDEITGQKAEVKQIVK